MSLGYELVVFASSYKFIKFISPSTSCHSDTLKSLWHATCATYQIPPYNVHHVHQPFGFMGISGERYSFITFTNVHDVHLVPPRTHMAACRVLIAQCCFVKDLIPLPADRLDRGSRPAKSGSPTSADFAVVGCRDRLYCVCYITLRFRVKQNKGLSWMSFGISEAIWLVVKEPTVCSANSRRRKAVGHPKPPIRETGMLYPRPFANSAKGWATHSLHLVLARHRTRQSTRLPVPAATIHVPGYPPGNPSFPLAHPATLLQNALPIDDARWLLFPRSIVDF